MRFRIDFAYDGTDFSGWARQPGRRTVEEELTGALTRVLRDDKPTWEGEPPPPPAATDSGSSSEHDARARRATAATARRVSGVAAMG